MSRVNLDGEIEFLVIQRAKSVAYCFPGGFFDTSEQRTCAAASREAWEEAIHPSQKNILAKLMNEKALLISYGVVNDSRNRFEYFMTKDGAVHEPRWIESDVFLTPLTYQESQQLKLRSNEDNNLDPKEVTEVAWMTAADLKQMELFADHNRFLLLALERINA